MSAPRAVTGPPGQHFFGYYEKSPWNADESALLAHRTDFQDRRPTPADGATICLIDDAAHAVTELATTHAWDFQQGSMLQWLGPDFDRHVIFNDRADDGFVARIVDVDTGEDRTLEAPIYAPTPDGTAAYTLDYDRLDVTRPGYGYASPGTDRGIDPHPHDEGVYLVDLETGRPSLLVSLDELAGFDPVPSMDAGLHWVNHLQISPSGERVAFIHRSETDDNRRWLDRLFVTDDGGDLQLVHEGKVSHYDWRTDEELLAWTDHDGPGFYRYTLAGNVKPVGDGVLPRDGHCSFSPDGEWLLLDSSADRHRHRGLYRYRWPDGPLECLAAVHSPPVEQSSLRCDLHPRWDRTGRRICFDATHGPGRQLYELAVPS